MRESRFPSGSGRLAVEDQEPRETRACCDRAGQRRGTHRLCADEEQGGNPVGANRL